MSNLKTYASHISAWLLLCCLTFAAGRAPAQVSAIRAAAANAPNDIQRITALTEAGKFYMYKPGEIMADLDSAFYFLDQARQLAMKAKRDDQYRWSLYYICGVWMEMKTHWRTLEVINLLNEEQQASIYANLCWQYTYKPGEYAYDLDTAVLYGWKSLDIALRIKHAQTIEQAATNLTSAYSEADRLTEAVKMLGYLPEPMQYKLYHRIGFAYQARRDATQAELDSAVMFTEASIRLGEKYDKPDLEARNYYVLCIVDLIRNRHTHLKPYIPHTTGLMKGDICWAVAQWYITGNSAHPDSARLYGQMALDAYTPSKDQGRIQKATNLLAAVDRIVASKRSFGENGPDVERFKKLVEMAKQYQSGFPAFDQVQLSISINYLHSAIRIADDLNADSLRIEAWKEMSKSQLLKGDVDEGRRYFQLILKKYVQQGKLLRQAHTWTDYGSGLRRQRPNFYEIAQAYTKASELYGKTNALIDEVNFGSEAASFLQEDGRADEAQALLLQILHKYGNTGHPTVYRIYRHLALLAHRRGDISAALQYALTGLRKAELTKDKQTITILLTRLAEIYHDLGQYDKSIDAYRQVVANPREAGINFDYFAMLALTQLLIEHRSPAEALALVQLVNRENPPTSYYPQHLIDGAFAVSYDALGKTAEAETHFRKSIQNMDNVKVNDRFYSLLQFNIGKFYLKQKQYTIAATHLQKAIRFRPDVASISLTNTAQYMLFQCDSALGQFRQAIDHYQLYKYYNDSLFNVAKIKQISELQIQYETEKKDQSLQLQEQEIRLSKQDILLLKRQGELQEGQLKQADLEKQQNLSDARRKDQDLALKEKDIAILTKTAQIQQGNLEKEVLMRNVSFTGAVLFLVIIGLLVNGYRLKQQHNQSLQDKQVEIRQKNHSLEKLLTEKEWLLKEIHHRVKNNLQIVMSLLNSQSAYLQNDDALVAIRDSQHRVQAISLIHKKLYQSDNVGVIHMPHYIHELVDYLMDCFDTNRKVSFRIDVSPLQLDVSQAVPIGLILNEAITNSIKYAFTGNREGIITISFKQSEEGHYMLMIADDGKGLPPDFDPGQSRSLGMSLMEGLSNDLGGHFSIGNHAGGGTEIKVWFEEEHIIRPELPRQPLTQAHN